MIFRRKRREPTEAEQAVQYSAEREQETRAQTPGIRAITAELRAARSENHFAERIRAAMEGQ